MKICLAVLLLTFVSITSAESNSQEQSAYRRLLTEAENALQRLDYEIDMVYIHDGLVESLQLTHLVKDEVEKEQLSYLDGHVREIFRYQDTIVCRFYDEPPFVASQGKRRAYSSNPILDRIRRINSNYRYILRGDDHIAGRIADVLEMQSVDALRYSYRFWIDRETKLVLKTEIVTPKEEIVEQFIVVALELAPALNVERLNPALLAVAKSSAAKVDEAKQTFEKQQAALEQERWQVRWLPSGFQLKSKARRTLTNQRDTHLLFSDGVAAISVYILESSSQLEKRAPKLMKRGSMTIYELANKNYRVTVLGEIPSETAKKIASSIVYRP